MLYLSWSSTAGAIGGGRLGKNPTSWLSGGESCESGVRPSER